jgi:hypothetical protein
MRGWAILVLLGLTAFGAYSVVAKAILHLGRNRFRDVMGLEMPVALKMRIIVNVSQASFSKLSTVLLCKLLRSDDLALRKSLCLKCLTVFKKNRLKKIVETYVGAEEVHYYNVIHWLDFGISMPSNVIRSAAKRRFEFGA